jgi:hypothetical protein
VTRNMELVRSVLLAIEADQKMDGNSWFQFDGPDDLDLTDCSYEELSYTLQLLDQAGFINAKSDMRMPLVSGLTWQGHEFLDTIRDPEIWRKTKERAGSVASVGISLIWEIAKSELKAKLGLP